MIKYSFPFICSESIYASSAESISISPFGINDGEVRSLVFERILGQGSYKTVYLVSGSNDDGTKVRYALAAERLRGKGDTKDAFSGVRIPVLLQRFAEGNDKDLFEKIIGWWIQPIGLPEYSEGAPVFSHDLDRLERTQQEPGKFLGVKYLISLKPVYEMDLKKFAQKAPLIYPVGESPEIKNVQTIAGLPLTEPVVIQFVLETIQAAKLIHATGLVHRDIKPKNIMISSRGRPVIIDYGFSRIGTTADKKNHNNICVVQPGLIKGELRYVLAQDVSKYQGCQRGDAYAMGKTLYEFIFGTAQGSEPSVKLTIDKDEAMKQNEAFRNIIFADDGVGVESRFVLTSSAANCFILVIRGLCRQDNPISFDQAENIILSYITSKGEF